MINRPKITKATKTVHTSPRNDDPSVTFVSVHHHIKRIEQTKEHACHSVNRVRGSHDRAAYTDI